jgi:hypothetical protein
MRDMIEDIHMQLYAETVVEEMTLLACFAKMASLLTTTTRMVRRERRTAKQDERLRGEEF